MKSVQIQSFFWSVFSCIETEHRKIKTKKARIWTLITQKGLVSLISTIYWNGGTGDKYNSLEKAR